MATAASELAGTSETATYGPPYNHESAACSSIGPIWQLLAGVRQPIDAAQTFVLSPLSKLAPTDPPLAGRSPPTDRASTAPQQTWDHGLPEGGHPRHLPRGVAGACRRRTTDPSHAHAATELTLARSGALDADLLAQHPFYGTDFTKPLLFLEDGNYFSAQATAEHLTGAQWGVMNETGSYPGQPWLWLYTLWYQVPGFDNSANVDLIAIYLTGVATLLLLAVPFLPGLRDIPRLRPGPPAHLAELEPGAARRTASRCPRCARGGNRRWRSTGGGDRSARRVGTRREQSGGIGPDVAQARPRLWRSGQRFRARAAAGVVEGLAGAVLAEHEKVERRPRPLVDHEARRLRHQRGTGALALHAVGDVQVVDQAPPDGVGVEDDVDEADDADGASRSATTVAAPGPGCSSRPVHTVRRSASTSLSKKSSA